MIVRVQGDPELRRHAAHLLHRFNTEYDEPTPPVPWLSERLQHLHLEGQCEVLLALDGDGSAVGVAVLRFSRSLWSEADEAYLAELYVVPDRRGQGHGRDLLAEVENIAQQRGADYLFLVTSTDDVSARRAYEAAGFRDTEGDGGPTMIAYEKELSGQ